MKTFSVTKTVELEFAPLHDILWELNLIPFGPDLTPVMYQMVFEALPEHIQFIAMEWGTSDTPFKDDAYEFISNHRSDFEMLLPKYED